MDARTSSPTVRHHVQSNWCRNACRSWGGWCCLSCICPWTGSQAPPTRRESATQNEATLNLPRSDGMLPHNFGSSGVSRAEEPAIDSTLSMSDMLSSTSVWAWILALTGIFYDIGDLPRQASAACVKRPVNEETSCFSCALTDTFCPPNQHQPYFSSWTKADGGNTHHTALSSPPTGVRFVEPVMTAPGPLTPATLRSLTVHQLRQWFSVKIVPPEWM